jgi:hypothetical protein
LTQQQQQELQIKIIKEALMEDILEIIKKNGPISFRNIMVKLPDVGAQDVWSALKELRYRLGAIELIKISNRKVAYQIQYGYARTMSATAQL